jgi:hypothetical protein
MAGRNTAVSGIYRLKNQAERALDMLIAGGIPCSSISVLLLDPADVETGGAISNNGTIRAGAAIGGTIGVLAGAGLVAIAGVGRMIGAGPIMAGFAGAKDATAGAADIGDLCRALVGIGISDLEARLYEGYVRCGGTLVSVSCNSTGQVSRAKELLTATGAEAHVESEPAATWRLAKS